MSFLIHTMGSLVKPTKPSMQVQILSQKSGLMLGKSKLELKLQLLNFFEQSQKGMQKRKRVC